MPENAFTLALQGLNLSQTEAAKLLSVNPRTVRRWVEGAPVPGPVKQALLAWQKLAERNLPWRPDSVAIAEDAQGQESLLERVRDRGGPAAPWKVDWGKKRATFGPMEVVFYTPEGGGFYPCIYTRKDKEPDIRRDWALIEDAIFCIHAGLRKRPQFGPVLLVREATQNTEGRWRIYPPEEYASNEAAMTRARTLMQEGGSAMHIRDAATNEVLWSGAEIRKIAREEAREGAL